MSTTPLVSIVTLAFNHGRYLRQCLDGFVMQITDFTFEVIIHDDASTDDTAQIIREYEEKYPHIFRPIYQTENQYSKGVAIGATYLYPAVRGKYICECEGDDWWTDPYKLQKQADFLEAHPEYSLCCTAYGSMRMRDGFVKDEKGTDTDISMRQLMKKNLIGTLTVMYRKELHQEYMEQVLPVMPKFRMGDIPLWLFMASKGKIRKLADQTAMYRKLEYSASHSDDFDRQLDFLLDASRIRLWMNGYLGAGYTLYLKLIMYSDVMNFCRKWSRSHGVGIRGLWKKAIKHI